MGLFAKVAGLSALAAAGVLLAVALPAQGRGLATTTTDETTTEVSTVVTTVESTAVLTTTVEATTTRQIVVPTLPTSTAAAESSSDNGTAVWIWALLAILGVGLIVFAILLARRGGHGHSALPPEERRRRLDAAVGSWVAQGWAIENQDADSAGWRRVGDLVLVQVDAAGHVSARPLGTQ
jgi:hypothetical protein